MSKINKSKINNIIYKAGLGITGLFTYHTYCGYKLSVSENSSACEELITNRVIYAISNGVVSVFPMLLISIYKDINRCEIFFRNKDPSDYTNVFDEALFKYKKK